MELRKQDLSAEQQQPSPYGQPGYPLPQQGQAPDSLPHSSYVPSTSQPYPGEAINPGYQPDYEPEYKPGYQPVSTSNVDSAVRRGDMVAANKALGCAKIGTLIAISIGICGFIVIIILALTSPFYNFADLF